MAALFCSCYKRCLGKGRSSTSGVLLLQYRDRSTIIVEGGMNVHLKTNEIGAFIQHMRKEQGMTQAEIAERLNVSAQSVSNWERGETLPDIAVLPDLAAVLRCSVDAILSGGAGCGGFRRHMTVAQMREAVGCLHRMCELLGNDHFIAKCILESLSTRMNTDVSAMLEDRHLREVLLCECLLACMENGDYIDLRDVRSNIPQCRAQEYVLDRLREKGVR